MASIAKLCQDEAKKKKKKKGKEKKRRKEGKGDMRGRNRPPQINGIVGKEADIATNDQGTKDDAREAAIGRLEQTRQYETRESSLGRIERRNVANTCSVQP